MVCQRTVYRTTWKLRLLLISVLLIVLVCTQRWWIPLLARNLVSDTGVGNPDLILVDNLDLDYQLFEKAARLTRSGVAGMVLIPVFTSGQDSERLDDFSLGIADAMIRVARLDKAHFIPIKAIEPITLNAARQVGDFLKGTDVRKVLLLTSGFKSRRLHLIFSKVLGELGIETYCLPVWNSQQPENWTTTWHGIQEVFLQYAKLAYYWVWALG